MATDMSVPNEILRQLGGNRFIAMTGAKLITGDRTSLGFHLPRKRDFVKNGANHVKIELTPLDAYDITFTKIGGKFNLDIKTLETVKGLDPWQMIDVFKDRTGLDLRI